MQLYFLDVNPFKSAVLFSSCWPGNSTLWQVKEGLQLLFSAFPCEGGYKPIPQGKEIQGWIKDPAFGGLDWTLAFLQAVLNVSRSKRKDNLAAKLDLAVLATKGSLPFAYSSRNSASFGPEYAPVRLPQAFRESALGESLLEEIWSRCLLKTAQGGIVPAALATKVYRQLLNFKGDFL